MTIAREVKSMTTEQINTDLSRMEHRRASLRNDATQLEHDRSLMQEQADTLAFQVLTNDASAMIAETASLTALRSAILSKEDEITLYQWAMRAAKRGARQLHDASLSTAAR